MPRRKRRSFTQGFKKSVVERMANAESIQGLADELGIQSKLLHNWRSSLRIGGEEAFRRVGRPSRTIPTEPEVSRITLSDAVESAVFDGTSRFPFPTAVGVREAGSEVQPHRVLPRHA